MAMCLNKQPLIRCSPSACISNITKKVKSEIFSNRFIVTLQEKTLWPLFMDGVQIPQD